MSSSRQIVRNLKAVTQHAVASCGKNTDARESETVLESTFNSD
jgi:hypothetical protein